MARYVLTNGKIYLRKNKNGEYIPTTAIENADFFTQRSKADNVLKNCVSKNLRKRYKIKEYNDIDYDKLFKAPAVEQEKPKTKKKTLKPNEEAIKNITENTTHEDKTQDFIDKFNSVSDVIVYTEERVKFLNDELSKIDQEKSDVEHWVELVSLNACQGYKAYKMLKVILQKRRKIKDELSILQKLGECKMDSKLIEEVQKSVETLNTRTYTPRRLKELFI